MAEGTCQTRLRISLKYYRELSRVEPLRKHAFIGVLKPLFSLLCKEQVGSGNNRRWKVLFKKEKKTTCKDSCSVTYLGDRKWERRANIPNPGVTAQLERGSTYAISQILGLE